MCLIFEWYALSHKQFHTLNTNTRRSLQSSILFAVVPFAFLKQFLLNSAYFSVCLSVFMCALLKIWWDGWQSEIYPFGRMFFGKKKEEAEKKRNVRVFQTNYMILWWLRRYKCHIDLRRKSFIRECKNKRLQLTGTKKIDSKKNKIK